MPINTFQKREASHQFGDMIGVRRPTGTSTAFLRGTTLGLYHQGGLSPAPDPSDGWSFGTDDRVWMFGVDDRIWRFGE